MNDFPENKNTLELPERQVTVIGPPLPPLADQLQTGIRFDEPVATQLRDSYLRRGERVDIEEYELVTNFFDFLAKVRQTAEADKSEEGRYVFAEAERFAQQATYLSVAARREAVNAIVSHHAAVLRNDPNAQLSFFVPQNSMSRSGGLLATEAKRILDEQNPDLKDRVKVENVLNETDDTKNVLLDDWSITGHQLTNDVAQALRSVGGTRAAETSKGSLEVNLLVARDDQLADNFALLRDVEANYGIDKPIPVIAYFQAAAARQHEGPMPTGAHSSVDYGFEMQINAMRDYLAARTKGVVNLPYIASIVRTQRDW